ncbi:MAG: AEC family transporter [Rubrivivax sp.]
MTGAVFAKLLAIFLTVALGWFVGRMRWLDPPGSEGADPARLLGNLAFHLFVPALLFRTTARLDFAAMPWHTVAAYFVPAVAFLLVVYAGERAAARQGGAAAAPSVRAIAATFGNSVQVGIPVATALFGERGLAIHIPLVSLHAIVLLSVLTALAELDIARERATTGQAARLWPTLHKTLRNTIVHPVVLPVLAGLAWNATGLALPAVLDESLAALGSAVVPVCLVLIGLTLAYQDLQGRWRGAAAISVLKLVALPALVLATARWGFGLTGLPLSVVVLMAALPVGSNALIFSQRYQTLEAETSAAIMLSTVGFAATASLWLAALALLG